MSNKWADYGISHVRCDSEKTHIVKVMVHEDNGETITRVGEWTRNQVVSAIEGGKTFVTILKGSNNNWNKGQPVRIIKVNGVKYIRTDENNKAADNLENLPEF
jgi:hypothetical protein